MGLRGPIATKGIVGADVAEYMPPPPHLSPEEAKYWEGIVRVLNRPGGSLSRADEGLIEKLVSLEAQWAENKVELAKSGQLYKDPSGRVVKSPRLGIMQELSDQIIGIYREMGMSPVSRKRFALNLPVKASPSKLALMVAKNGTTDTA